MEKEYTLQPHERQLLQGLNIEILIAKAEVHDLQAKLDAAHAKVEQTQSAFNGASTMLIQAQGLVNVQYQNNFERMVQR